MRQPPTLFLDAYLMGAQDLRAGRPPVADLPDHDQATYDHGRRRALRLACARLDAAVILPEHFTQERPNGL